MNEKWITGLLKATKQVYDGANFTWLANIVKETYRNLTVYTLYYETAQQFLF